MLLVVTEVYRQQLWMYQNESNRIDDRIVSITQPHIRPIVRVKAGKPVEFERGGRCEAKQLVQPRCWRKTFSKLLRPICFFRPSKLG